jgi:stage II sporulation protein M
MKKTTKIKNTKKSKQGFFGRNYISCWEYLKESKNYIYFSAGIFVLFALIGFIFPIFFKQQILDFIKNLSLQVSGLNFQQLFSFIFLNNLRATFFSILLGIGFGIFPLITAIVNGYLLGFVARYSVNEGGLLVLWRLLPHGIFEIPAVILSLGIGMKLGLWVFTKKQSFKEEVFEALRFFIFVVLPLLLIAGIIESLLIALLR